MSKSNNEVYKRNVYYSGALEWNKLDAEDRNVKDFFILKRKQHGFLIHINTEYCILKNIFTIYTLKSNYCIQYIKTQYCYLMNLIS